MPALNFTVSLSEALEVRDGPLTELEIYACLCRGAETLQDHFITGEATNEFGPAFVINPDTIQLTFDGQIQFGLATETRQYANYMAQEIEEGFVMTPTAIEQIYVFALGKSLIYCSEYGLKPEEHNSSNSTLQQMSKPIRISDSLESLLRKMTNRNSSQRIPLVKVMEICALQNKKHQRGHKSFSLMLKDLYNSLLTSPTQETPQNNTAQQPALYADIDRSRRKRRSSDGRDKKKPSQSMYRSRSRSRSRSDSRSRSRKGEHRAADSPDSRHHRRTPLLDRTSSRASSVGYKRNPSPDMRETHKSARNTHLADITNGTQNAHAPQKKSSSSHSRPSNRNNPANSHRAIDNPAFKKYLKLKERQRKLRALHMQKMDEDASSELSDIVLDHMSDSKSLMSLASYNVGIYKPDLHVKYGSNSALRIGYDSDRDSIISSEASMVVQDNVLRAAPDGSGSDAYITWLQQLTTGHAQIPPAHHQQQTPTLNNNANTHAKPSKHKKIPSPKQQKKEFYGPEFVHRSSKPIQRIPIAIQGDSRKSPGHLCRVVVVLLSGQKLEVMVDPSTTGQQLFEAVTTQIFLPEFYFFGLTYINDNEHFFILSDTKLHKVAPDNWKESWKPQVPPITFTVYLRVKFYVETLAVLKHEVTRHQIYLQLRRDILEERCYCNEDTALTLAGLAMQVEYGDYDKDAMGRSYFVPEHYFSGRTLKRLGSRFIHDHAPEAHAECKQLSEVDAEIEFIRIVQELLPEYGIHFHKLLKNKGDTTNVIWVGINMNQLALAETNQDQRVTFHEYPWPAIEKISFNHRRFSVKPRPEFGQLKPVKMNFYTNTYKKGQYLLKFCTAQHSFQLKMKTRAQPNQPDFGSGDHVSIGNTEDMDSVHSEDDQTITGDHGSQQDVSEVEMESGASTGPDHAPTHKQLPAYRVPPPYHPKTSVSMIELPMVAREIRSQPAQHVTRSSTTGDVDVVGVEDGKADDLASVQSIPEYAASQAYVIDTSSHPNQTLYPQSGNETISNTLDARCRDELLSPATSIYEGDVFEVELEKTKSHGIGITIVGGGSPGKHDYGIFVKSVLLDGPAFKDGRIQPGDRILAVEGENLQGMPHHDAVNLIKTADSSVKLLISQVKPPRSIKKPEARNSLSNKKQFSSRINDTNTDTVDENHSDTMKDVNYQSNSKMNDIHSETIEDINLNSGEDSPSPTAVESELDISVYSCYSVEDSMNKIEATLENTQKKLDADIIIPNHESDDVNNYDSEDDDVYKEEVEDEAVEEDIVCEVSVRQHSDFPLSQPHTTHSESDSDADCDFDTVVNQVIENKYETHTVPALYNQQHTEDSNHGESINSIETEEFEVFLDKQCGGFGLNVTGGVNTSVRHGGIYVKSVIPNSAAFTDGSIHKGDRILEVDGQSLAGYTHKQAVQTLCDAPPFCKLKLQRRVHSSPVSNSSQSPESVHETFHPETREDRMERKISKHNGNAEDIYKNFVTDDNTYCVELKKGSYGLGFSILASQSNLENVVRIKRVFPIGPAADSRIKSGDVILAVNGTSVKGCSQTEAMSLLRGAGKLVSLQMCHPDPENLPPLLHLESEESLEITPTSSTSHASVSEDDDSDSEFEETPRPVQTITPPAGFAPSPFPQDQDGLILPKVASPPPPLPVSPPPTLIRREESDSGSEAVEVEVGVAELMDSCRSEMVFIHNVKQQSPQPFNSSLIVREDSALTVESGEATPVPCDSREATPCVNIDGESTPINELDNETTEDSNSYEKNSVVDTINESHNAESPQSASETQLGVTLSTIDSIDVSLSGQSQYEDVSDSDIDSKVSHTRTNTSSFLVDDKPASIDEHLFADNCRETSETSPVELVSKVPLQIDQSGVNIDKDRTDTTETGDNVIDYNSDDCVYIADHVHNSDGPNSSGESDDDDELSDKLRRLENKYIEQEKLEEICVEEEDLEDKYVEQEEESQKEESQLEEQVSQSDESVHTQDWQALSQSLEDQPLQPGELEVMLTKPVGKGLGFTVAGGVTRGGCYVKAVLQDPALSDGRLRPGDKLIMVNNIDMRSLSHFEAVTVLCEAIDTVNIRIYRASLNAVDDTEEASVIEPFHGQGGLTGQPHQILDTGTFELPRGSTISDEIESESESEEWTAEVDQTSCDEHSLSAQHPIQDLIQSLEQSRLETKPHDNSNKVENYWRDKSQREAEGVLNMSPKSPEPSVYQFDLHKSESGGLGISLVTAETRNQTGVFIKTIMPGGVADEDGRLQVGDKILQINGESLVGLNHNKAAAILRNSHGKLSLTVSRNKKRNPFLVEEAEEGASEQDAESVREVEQDCVEEEEVDRDISSSLSLSHNTPDDTEDDHMDDLVAEAVRVLNETNHELNKDDTLLTSASDNDSDDSRSDLSAGQQAKTEHKYLSTFETIDYAPDEINAEGDIDKAMEQIYCDNEESDNDIAFREDKNGADFEDKSRDCDNGAIREDSDQRCWCDSLRKLDIALPDEITGDWLCELKVATIQEELIQHVPDIVADMQEKIEIDDPQGEFKQLRRLTLTDQCLAAHEPHNKPKNRFRNVLPYDYNRIKLSENPDMDYINASHIRYPVKNAICDYIACQGPLPDTTNDFWMMVWQQDVTVIVMLTLDMEAMKVKCHRYWPESVETPVEVCNGKYQLSLLYLNSLENFDIRNILMEDLETGESRSVFHFNYTTWPDHGTPQSAMPLLQCMRLSHQFHEKGPMIVHCSAGIGRSGTFITIDVALAHIEAGLKFDILEIVKELRRQRQGMIQTRDQYVFCYSACVEALSSTISS